MAFQQQYIWRNRIHRALKTPFEHWKREVMLRLRRRLFWERWLDGKAMPPYSVGLWLTESCDMNCPMCWVHPHNIASNKGDETSLSKLEWFQLIDHLLPWKPRLTITGGEPLLVPYLVNLIRYASGKGFRVNLSTNGFRLATLAKDLVESGLQDLSVSLDGPAHVHDTIRGKPGAFEAVREGIECVRKARENTHSTLPYIRLNCTLTRNNQRHLADVVKLAADWGVDSLSFQHLWFTTPEVLEQHNREFQLAFGQDSRDLTGFLVSDLTPDPHGLVDEINHIALRSDNHLPLYVYPQLKPADIQTFYRHPEISLKPSCRSRWFRTDIRPNGDVSPCLSYVAGNVRHESFAAIWNNDRYRQFRRQILRGIFAGCSRCCGLFSD
jgi:MoaA/NifB/PqqE/SkfB family radical SAM enzyme